MNRNLTQFYGSILANSNLNILDWWSCPELHFGKKFFCSEVEILVLVAVDEDLGDH